MNYRHAFHAGNFADVFKHAILAIMLDRLRQKPAPFCVLDTHAGTGLYALDGDEASRTGEAARGIRRLDAALASPGASPPAALQPFRDALTATRMLYGAAAYPGSPLVIRHGLRAGDRMVLCELHPDDAQTLRRVLAGERRAGVHHQDGYLGLKAHLPPRERRGLVLLDPPYEHPGEAQQASAALASAHARWPTGLYALWYPIKERPWVWRLHEAVAATGIARVLNAELLVHPEDDARRLNGCGFLLVNPPWLLEQDLGELLPWLHQTLAPNPTGNGWQVNWLVPESP